MQRIFEGSLNDSGRNQDCPQDYFEYQRKEEKTGFKARNCSLYEAREAYNPPSRAAIQQMRTNPSQKISNIQARRSEYLFDSSGLSGIAKASLEIFACSLDGEYETCLDI